MGMKMVVAVMVLEEKVVVVAIEGEMRQEGKKRKKNERW